MLRSDEVQSATDCFGPFQWRQCDFILLSKTSCTSCFYVCSIFACVECNKRENNKVLCGTHVIRFGRDHISHGTSR